MQTMNGRTFLSSAVLINMFLFTFLYLFYAHTKSPRSVRLYQQYISKTRSPRKHNGSIIFSKFEYLKETRKPSENVIVFLVDSISGDVHLAFNVYPVLRERVLQLDERLGDNYSTDVIIFHTGYPFRDNILSIIEASRRQIEFVNIDHIFYKFSPGFDPYITDPIWSRRSKWNYQHMCYFWFKQVFEQKILHRYRYMMRLDDDSQLRDKWPNIFDLMIKQQAVYFANQREVETENDFPGLTLVRNFTAAYIIKNNITAQNPDMLADVFNGTVQIPNYSNNIEVVDLSFMRRKEVLDFIQAVDESKGIFLYRWGNAPLRYITLALFANATEVLHRQKLKLDYCHRC